MPWKGLQGFQWKFIILVFPPSCYSLRALFSSNLILARLFLRGGIKRLAGRACNVLSINFPSPDISVNTAKVLAGCPAENLPINDSHIAIRYLNM
jgi:hypothetical protein